MRSRSRSAQLDLNGNQACRDLDIAITCEATAAINRAAMHVCSFVPVTGASFRKRSGQSLDTGRRATAPSRARCRQRSHVLAVAQVSGESKVTPAPEACSEQPEDDGPKRFTVITKVYETPGGWLVDAAATNFGKQTK